MANKSRQSHETARTLVSPLFAWTNAILKGGEMMLDSMQAATRNASSVRVAVLHDLEAPRRGNSSSARSGNSRRAKGRRRR